MKGIGSSSYNPFHELDPPVQGFFCYAAVLCHLEGVNRTLSFIERDFDTGLHEPFCVSDTVIVEGIKFRSFDKGFRKPFKGSCLQRRPVIIAAVIFPGTAEGVIDLIWLWCHVLPRQDDGFPAYRNH